jgi:hypothetical protein
MACSSASPLRNATNIKTSGANFESLKLQGGMEYLYPISVVSTISGTYTLDIKQGAENPGRTIVLFEDSISNPTVAFQCLPAAPYSKTSFVKDSHGMSSVAGETGSFDVLTRDRFHNQRVDIVEAIETSMFFVELTGPAPHLQVQKVHSLVPLNEIL